MSSHLYGASASSELIQAPLAPRPMNTIGSRQHAAHRPNEARRPPPNDHFSNRLRGLVVQLQGGAEFELFALIGTPSVLMLLSLSLWTSAIATVRKSVHIRVNSKSRPNMKTYSIGQIAKQTGVPATALRYYEDAGILPAPARIGGRRSYDARAVRHIDVLRFAQRAGFTLEEIRTLFHGFGAETPLSARWQALARAKLRELELLAKRIRRMKRALTIGLECGCIRIEDCLLSPKDAESPRRVERKSCCG
ncbi:MAG TPA: MerR family transcriptional regulator [Steroidobacteraceae bacterium]|nr:MerR family transcriptional regulator [Steroidobacteraceae bacterium]